MLRRVCLILAFLTLALSIPLTAAGQSKSPLQIVQEARATRSTPIGHEHVAPLLREIAGALNAAQLPDGPFGILVKTSGENCSGYSCDIICAGNGAAQRQWDVFVAAEGPASPSWSAVETITVRPCEVVPASIPDPQPDPDPDPEPDPQPDSSLGPILLQVIALLEEIRAGQGATRAATDAQTVALKAAIAELQAQVKQGVKIRF